MGHLKLLLFDLDGVLVDTTSLLKKCYVGLAEYLNARNPTEEELKDAIQISPAKAIRYFFKDQRYEVLQAFNHYWKQSIKQASAFPGIRELLDELLACKVVIGTVTSRNNSDTLTLLTSARLLNYMRIIITWGRYRIAKPSPACLLIALAETSTLPGSAAYVGDQAIDMRAAKNAGVLAIGAVWDVDANKEELESAGADIIVEKPIKITNLLKDVM